MASDLANVDLAALRATVGTDCADAMARLTEAVGRIDGEVKQLKLAIDSAPPVSYLVSALETILSSSTPSAPMSAESEVSLSQTPETPSSAKSRISGNAEDYAYPSTPTLDSLGLSGRTMALVGGTRDGESASSYSVSDMEYETSFMKSPAGHANSRNANDSFSSDMSVPQFRIVTSSPGHQLRHPLSQNVTNASDSSLILESENMPANVPPQNAADKSEAIVNGTYLNQCERLPGQ